jgi:hypothetical protein
LVSYGVPAATGGLLTASVKETLRVLVGPWQVLRSDHAIDTLEHGPGESGVYAKLASSGRSIAALDAQGHTVRTLGAGTGLVAATQTDDDKPIWIVTGTDEAGVSQAVKAFDEGTLDHKFAVAVNNDLPIALPVAR